MIMATMTLSLAALLVINAADPVFVTSDPNGGWSTNGSRHLRCADVGDCRQDWRETRLRLLYRIDLPTLSLEADGRRRIVFKETPAYCGGDRPYPDERDQASATDQFVSGSVLILRRRFVPV